MPAVACSQPAATPCFYFQPLCQHEVLRVISTLNAGTLCSRHVNYGNTINVFLFFRKKALSSIIYLEFVLPTERCRQKHGGFYVTIDLLSWGHPLTNGSNVRVRQSSTPP